MCVAFVCRGQFNYGVTQSKELENRICRQIQDLHASFGVYKIEGTTQGTACIEAYSD